MSAFADEVGAGTNQHGHHEDQSDDGEDDVVGDFRFGRGGYCNVLSGRGG